MANPIAHCAKRMRVWIIGTLQEKRRTLVDSNPPLPGAAQSTTTNHPRGRYRYVTVISEQYGNHGGSICVKERKDRTVL